MATKTNARSNIPYTEVKAHGAGLQPLSEVALFHRSLQHSTFLDSEAPRLILLFGFMNAPLPVLKKNYISKYAEKWPSASIIVITFATSWLYTSQIVKDRQLMPAIEIILKEMYEPKCDSHSNGLLVHVMSNGGGFMFTSFMDLLERVLKSRDRDGEIRRQPMLADHTTQSVVLAVILDSVPSHAGLMQRGSSFLVSIKNPLIKSMASVPASIAFTTLLASRSLLGSQPSFYSMNARLLSKDIIPSLSDYSTPRLYVYSEADEHVDYRDVEAHLRQLRKAIGADQRSRSLNESLGHINVEKFGLDSPHVMHVRTDAKRYWGAVDRLWEEALSRATSVKSKAKL